jgi:hypothetical protein
VWNLTGSPAGGVHATDPSNAARTLLMDLRTLDWDDLLDIIGIPRAVLPLDGGRQPRVRRRRYAAQRRWTNTPSALMAGSFPRTGRRQIAHARADPSAVGVATRTGRPVGGDDIRAVWAGRPTPASCLRTAPRRP